MDVSKALSTNLKRLRKERGLSQAALAELAGLEPMSIWNWESGTRWPRPANFDVLAKALAVRPWQLLAEDAQEPNVDEGSSRRR